MTSTRLLPIIGALALLFGCTDDAGEDTQTHAGELSEDANLDDAPPCDAETQCPDGLECLVIRTDPAIGPLCLEPGTGCDVLDCGDDDCLLLESYPAQVACAGPPAGDDGDGPVSSGVR